MNALQKSNAADVATVEQQIEQHAQNIERIQRGAIVDIGRELSEAQELFKYTGNDGGFTGWLADRLPHISQSSAYRAIDAFKGIDIEMFPTLGKLSDKALLETAAAQPDIKTIIAERVEAGEVFTAAQVKEIKDAAAKQADEFKAKLEADQRAKIERLESEKTEAEKRIKALEALPKEDASQPTFDAERDAAVKAKQDEIDALKAKIEAANNDPVMKAMREAVEDAARTGGKKSSNNKNPDYKKPTEEYDVMMSVVGSCRILLERNRKAKPAQVLAGFYDDDHRAAGLKDIAKCRDFLTSILELANA